MNDIINGIINILTSTTVIAAVISATLAHIWNQFRENKIKSYETRKKEYFEFIDLTLDIVKASSEVKQKNLSLKKSKELNEKLDKLQHLSLKLAVIGSKELYELYLFFRWIGQNTNKSKADGQNTNKSKADEQNTNKSKADGQNTNKSKADEQNTSGLKLDGLCSDNTTIFIMGEMFQAMRKEIALGEGKIDVLDIMESFLVNVRTPEILEEFELYNKNKPKLKQLYLDHKKHTHTITTDTN